MGIRRYFSSKRRERESRPGEPASYLAPYQQAVREHGASFDALLWRSEHFQEVRFRTICEMVRPTGRVIADMGSGQAGLLTYLHDKAVRYAHYIGVEALPELLEASRTRVKDAGIVEAEFVRADFAADEDLFANLVLDQEVDVIIFCGSLNTMEQGLAETVLGRAWDAIAKTPGAMLVFNFLSDTKGPSIEGDPANRFDTKRLIAWALERTPSIAFRQDYLDGHDATILMRA